MSETVVVAIIVAVTSLIASYIPLRVKRKYDREENRRIEICKCFSEFFGLIGVQPSAKSIFQFSHDENAKTEKSDTDKWFYRFNALFWEMRMYTSKEHPALNLVLQRLADNIADIYELRGQYIFLSSPKFQREDDLAEISDEIIEKLAEQEKILDEFMKLSSEYAHGL